MMGPDWAQLLMEGENSVWLPWALMTLALWETAWKGIGLWKAGRNGQKYWFVVLLLINSVGVLPMVYLKWFQKKTK